MADDETPPSLPAKRKPGRPKGFKQQSPEEREILAAEAYTLTLKQLTLREIARQLSAGREHPIGEKTVGIWVNAVRARMADERTKRSMNDLEQFLGEQEAVSAKGWEILDNPEISATAKAHIMQDVLAASVNKAKALGIFTDRVQYSGDADKPILITLKASTDAPTPPQLKQLEG